MDRTQHRRQTAEVGGDAAGAPEIRAARGGSFGWGRQGADAETSNSIHTLGRIKGMGLRTAWQPTSATDRMEWLRGPIGATQAPRSPSRQGIQALGQTLDCDRDDWVRHRRQTHGGGPSDRAASNTGRVPAAHVIAMWQHSGDVGDIGSLRTHPSKRHARSNGVVWCGGGYLGTLPRPHIAVPLYVFRSTALQDAKVDLKNAGRGGRGPIVWASTRMSFGVCRSRGNTGRGLDLTRTSTATTAATCDCRAAGSASRPRRGVVASRGSSSRPSQSPRSMGPPSRTSGMGQWKLSLPTPSNSKRAERAGEPGTTSCALVRLSLAKQLPRRRLFLSKRKNQRSHARSCERHLIGVLGGSKLH